MTRVPGAGGAGGEAATAPRPRPGPTGSPVDVAHVYVHAPFCARRCFYCDFAVTVRRNGEPEEWAGALAEEVRLLEEEGAATLAPALRTLYVGGGTPSLLGPNAMERLARTLGEERLGDPGLEWTAEANPESLTGEVASGWRRAGVNRLSLGVQSFQEPVLRWMGRLHGARGAVDAVETALASGMTDLSVDLIFGLPASLERDWREDIEAAVALDVSHVSLYGLTAEPETPLGRRVREGRVRMPEDERYRDEYLEAHQRLTAEGFVHYEVSNFARPGRESRHNRAYWDHTPYLGLGNSSHSFLPPVRRWNLRGWEDYVERIRQGLLPVGEEEMVGAEGRTLEEIWLGLRTDAGVSLSRINTTRATELVREWERKGLAHPGSERLRLSPEGWLLLDELALELDRALAAPSRSG